MKVSAGLELPRTAIGFRLEFLDFQRGIRVGNLKDNERITRILKLALESRYGEPFVTERYGRGAFWQWIGFVPRENRAAKPISSDSSFDSSKFFLMVDTDEQVFKCGMQVERGYMRAPRESRRWKLEADWDWHRLLEALKPKSAMERELKRLVTRAGFMVYAGSWEEPAYFGRLDFPGMLKLRRLLQNAPKNRWAGFQVFYPMGKREVRGSTGVDLVDSMLAIFDEVTPAMNLCMQVRFGANSGA